VEALELPDEALELPDDVPELVPELLPDVAGVEDDCLDPPHATSPMHITAISSIAKNFFIRYLL